MKTVYTLVCGDVLKMFRFMYTHPLEMQWILNRVDKSIDQENFRNIVKKLNLLACVMNIPFLSLN